MVNLVNISIKQLINKKANEKLYIFGASKRLKSYKNVLPFYSLSSITDYIVDNNDAKWGTQVKLDDNYYTILSPYQMIKTISKRDKILITTICYAEVVSQLDNIAELDGIDCYILDYIYAYNDSRIDMSLYEKCKSDKYLIPPVINYCWFGKNPIPQEYLYYIDSWKKMCPDYEIVRWDESNYDVNKHPYMAQAYKEKKWAFVSDYARLDIVYHFGGIYLDTDVELIKNLDELRRFNAYVGFESETFVNTGLGFGAVKRNKLIGKLMHGYDEVVPGNYITCPQLQSMEMDKIGLVRNDTFQYLDYGDVAVLPSEFLCPLEYRFRQEKMTENTFSIHHYSGSWLETRAANDKYVDVANRMKIKY